MRPIVPWPGGKRRLLRFYYLQRCCWGGKVSSRTFGIAASGPPRLNLLRMEEDLSQAHLRLARVTVENLSWRDCVERYDRPETLFFMDPPYWATEGYGIEFGLDQYADLAEAMRGMRGQAILTINDHPAMREAFAGFRVERVGISYTLGGGNRRAAAELIYRTW